MNGQAKYVLLYCFGDHKLWLYWSHCQQYNAVHMAYCLLTARYGSLLPPPCSHKASLHLQSRWSLGLCSSKSAYHENVFSLVICHVSASSTLFQLLNLHISLADVIPWQRHHYAYLNMQSAMYFWEVRTKLLLWQCLESVSRRPCPYRRLSPCLAHSCGRWTFTGECTACPQWVSSGNSVATRTWSSSVWRPWVSAAGASPVTITSI